MLRNIILVSGVGFLLGESALADPVAVDNASNAAYAFEVGGAWTGLLPTVDENPPGMDNGGFGFSPWNFEGGAHDASVTPYGRLNHFIDGVDLPPSSFNDLGSPAFGLTNANIAGLGVTARATRVFSEPLAVGGMFRVEFDNPAFSPLGEGDETGYIIRLNSGGGANLPSNPNVSERLGFFADFGFNEGNWNRTDASGENDTGVSSAATTSGALLQVTLQSPETYLLEILPLGGGDAFYSATGSLANPGAGDIDTVEIVHFGNGSGNGIIGAGALPTGEREFFFDNLLLDNPALPLTGDYNRNGTVDAADYALWRHTLNQTVPIGDGADGNRDGLITQLDYDIWRQNFGRSAAAAAVISQSYQVPEPSAVSSFWLVIVVAAFASRRAMWNVPVTGSSLL